MSNIILSRKGTIISTSTDETFMLARIEGILDYLEAGFLVGGLLSEPASGEGLLVGGGDKDTAFGVFGAGTSMEADAGSAWHLAEDRQRALELRTLRDLYAVDECRDEVICVFEGVADIVQTFYQFTGTFVGVVRNSVQLAVNGLTRIRFGTNRRKVISD